MPAGATSWAQTGLGANSPQQVYVEAFAGAETSVSSGSGVSYSLANPPTNLAVAVVAESSVTLSWSNNLNPNGTTYRITTTQAGGGSTTTDVVGNMATITATLSGLQMDTDHTFQVRAMNGSGILSDQDAEISARTLPPSSPPAAPGAPAASARASSSIAWSWADNASNESGYRVRAVSGGADLSGPLPAGTTAWVQTGLGPNLRQEVYVQAFNAAGLGNSSGSGTIYTLANSPINLKADFNGEDAVDLSWDQNGNPPGTTYRAQLSIIGGTPIAQTTTGAQTRFTGIKLNAPYSINLEAINGDGISSPALNFLSVTFTPVNDPHPYPVPWRAEGSSAGITFTKLPNPSVIRIYTLSGKLVRELSPSPGSTKEIWDVRNGDGKEVITGTYVYVVESQGSLKRGKLVVSR